MRVPRLRLLLSLVYKRQRQLNLPPLPQPTFRQSDLPSKPPATLLPVATSRGPDLEATDPTTVNLASGQVQFVEFFRFT